jgi:hypothetical protein
MAVGFNGSGQTVIRVPRVALLSRYNKSWKKKKEMLVTAVVMNRINTRNLPVPEHLRHPNPGLLCSASSPTFGL